MRTYRASLLLFSLAAGVAFGCDDAGKRPIQAHVSAVQSPLTQAAVIPAKDASARTQNAPAIAPLPLWSRETQSPVSLLATVPDGRAFLISKVEEKFASGEQNFKAGHLDAARRDFNDAVDWMLESGYDPNSDPKLSELFHRVVDTVYTYELQAFRAGDGFQETPAVPAPIDEVAEMTFPVDPRLKERAEEAAKNISHDLQEIPRPILRAKHQVFPFRCRCINHVLLHPELWQAEQSFSANSGRV